MSAAFPVPSSAPKTLGIATELFAAGKKIIISVQPAAQSFFLSGTEHLNSSENPNSTKLLSHVDSLMADKGLSPCCTLAASTGGSIPASLPPHHILGRVHPSSCRSFLFPSPVVPGDGGGCCTWSSWGSVRSVASGREGPCGRVCSCTSSACLKRQSQFWQGSV